MMHPLCAGDWAAPSQTRTVADPHRRRPAPHPLSTTTVADHNRRRPAPGHVACKLAAGNYGREEWWLLLDPVEQV